MNKIVVLFIIIWFSVLWKCGDRLILQLKLNFHFCHWLGAGCTLHYALQFQIKCMYAYFRWLKLVHSVLYIYTIQREIIFKLLSFIQSSLRKMHDPFKPVRTLYLCGLFYNSHMQYQSTIWQYIRNEISIENRSGLSILIIIVMFSIIKSTGIFKCCTSFEIHHFPSRKTIASIQKILDLILMHIQSKYKIKMLIWAVLLKFIVKTELT